MREQGHVRTSEYSKTLVTQPEVSQQVSINKPCMCFLRIFTVCSLPVSLENHGSALTQQIPFFQQCVWYCWCIKLEKHFGKIYLILKSEQDFPLKINSASR